MAQPPNYRKHRKCLNVAIYISADHFDGAHNKRTSIISKYAGSTTLSLGPGRVPSHLSGFSSHLISGHHSPGSVVSQLIGTPVPGALGGNAVPEKASLANGSIYSLKYIKI